MPKKKSPCAPAPAFGPRFKAARIAAGYRSQSAVAEALGVTQGYIGQIESGYREVSLDQRYELALKLGVDPHELDERLSHRGPAATAPAPDRRGRGS